MHVHGLIVFIYFIIVIVIFVNHILFGMVSSIEFEFEKKQTNQFPHLDWTPGISVPLDIKIMYFVQCGFYLHSIYGTLYMDYKRKDFYVMLLHHVLTMTLIFVSYATR
jgi:hypothetical protein